MHGEESFAPLCLAPGVIEDGTDSCTQSPRTQPYLHSSSYTQACAAEQASETQQTKTMTAFHFRSMLQGESVTAQALAAAAAVRGRATAPEASQLP